MQTDVMIPFLEARLAVFYLLQRAFAAPSTRESVADLNEATGLYGLTEPLTMEEPATEEAEYNRLFVGPGRLPAPLYESVWRSEDRLLMQDQTLQVRAIYRRYGLESRYGCSQPDDHVAVELEFYAALQMKALGDLAMGRTGGFAALIQAQQSFFTLHLYPWVPAFCEAIGSRSTSSLFRGLAACTKEVLAREPNVLEHLLTSIPAKEEPVHA